MMVEKSLAKPPMGWVRTTLGEVSLINPKFDGNGIPDDIEISFVPMKAVKELSGIIDLSLKRKLSEVKKGYTAFKNGDLLFAKITPCMENGKVAIANNLFNGLGFGSTEFHVIRLIPPLPSKLFFFYLIQQFLREDARKNMKGTAGQLRVPSDFMAGIPIPLPPLPEQHRIVAKIEELFSDLDAGVAALKQAQALLKRYRQTVLKAAFTGKLTAQWREAHRGELESKQILQKKFKNKPIEGLWDERIIFDEDTIDIPREWIWIRVAEITESMQNGIYKPKDFYDVDGIACLRMYNIENGIIIWKDIKRMILTKHEIENYQLDAGDILINRVNSRELVGKAAVIPHGLEKCVYESKNIRLKIKHDIVDSKFVNFWFLANGRRYFDKNTQQVVGMASINQGQIGSMPIPYTSLSEQEEIVRQIEYRFSIIDEIAKSIDFSLKQGDQLRQSILKQAFSGKLVPQDPADEPAEKLLARIRAEKAQAPVKPTSRRRVPRQKKIW